jgi:AsmA protein
VVLVVAVIALPFVVPTETIKQQVTQRVGEATGRTLTIGGDFGLSVFPQLALSADRVALSNAPGAADPNMVTLKELRVALQVLPLLGGNVKVDSFILVEPEIILEVDKQGRPNWEMTAGAAEPTASDSAAPSSEAGGSSGGIGGLGDISLGDVRLERGRVTYRDARSGQEIVLSDINVAVSLPGLDDPFSVKGDMAWNGEQVGLSVESTGLRALMDGAQSPVKLAVQSKHLTLDFTGQVQAPKPLRVDGTLGVASPSVRDLATWTGNPLTMEGTGLGPFDLSGTVNVRDQAYAFKSAKLAIDNISGTGDFAVDMAGDKPALKGTLDLGEVDLNPYLPPEQESAGGGHGDGQPAAGASSEAAPSDWSDEPIDLSGLHAADVDFKLQVAGIKVKDLKIGASAVNTVLKGGRLQLDLARLALYEGQGKGSVVVDARQTVPVIEEVFSLAGVQAAPILHDAAKFDRLEGTANSEVSLTTKGGTERALVQNLNGKGKVTFLDGAIRGINIAAMVRNATTAFLDKSAGEAQKTDFAELSGSFVIRNGLLDNQDAKLLSPLLRVAGKGKVDLPKRTVDYRVEPKLVASLKGQGGEDDKSGLMIPFLITGPWDKPSVKPDLAAAVGDIAKDPAKALKTLGGDGKLPGSVGETLKSLGGQSGDGGEEEGTPDAGKALKKLFGN